MHARQTSEKDVAGKRSAKPVAAGPATGNAARLATLQRQAGNRNVGQALQRGGPASAASPLPVQRMPSGGGGGYRMRSSDVGEKFDFTYHGEWMSGRYLGPGSDGREKFSVKGDTVRVKPRNIQGVHRTVGGLRPPGASGDPDDRAYVKGRRRVNVSDGDLSFSRAQTGVHPDLATDLVVTSFDSRDVSYRDYEQNRSDLHRRGASVQEDFDATDPRSRERIDDLGPDPTVHLQMPRVSMGTKGLSTQGLIDHGFGLVPEDRDDYRVTVTTPDPDHSERNLNDWKRNYRLTDPKAKSRSGHGSRMELTKKHKESREDGYERYGYSHKQNTKDESTDLADYRETYEFKSKNRKKDRSASPEYRDYPPSSSRRDRDDEYYYR